LRSRKRSTALKKAGVTAPVPFGIGAAYGQFSTNCGKMSIRRVVPDIKSERFGESRDFYVGLLGFEVAMDTEWIMTFASPTNPTAQVCVMKRDATANIDPDVSIEVADVDSVHAQALRRGDTIVYPLTDEPWDVRRFFVRDPNGSVINVLSHINESKTAQAVA